MSKRRTTPKTLATAAGIDVDDALILLWDSGIEYVASPDSMIKPFDVSRAERACGLADVKERTRVEYWQAKLSMSEAEFRSTAAELGIPIGANARRLPKGALARLVRHYSNYSASQSSDVSENPPSEGSPPAATHAPREAFRWATVGRDRGTPLLLSKDEIEQIHWRIAEDFANTSDPIAPAGIRFPDLLASAAERPNTGIGEVRKYPSAEMAAAALVHSLVHNHPFYNGNKRTALVSMLTMLDTNSLVVNCSENELFKWIVRVAQHSVTAIDERFDRSDQEVLAMAKWVTGNSRLADRTERVITAGALKTRLIALGCTVTITSNRGGRYLVEREVMSDQRSLFGNRKRSTVRRYSLPYGGQGRQVAKGHIKDLRRELGLSEDDGVDSAFFYGSDSNPVAEFIATYRKLLRRLART